MSTKHAVYDIAEFKALPDSDDDKGRFEAIVSVFGNVDVQGDRVVQGAFSKSLEKWRASGAPIPVLWSHNWGDPNAHIGSADPNDVVEVDGKGLKVTGSIDLDNPFAAQVYRLMKERRVKEFSFGYEVIREKRAKDGANDLLELGIIEVGPTLKGANPSTELVAIKSQLEEAALHDPSAEPPAIRDSLGTKVYGTIAGSVEERQRKISDGLRAAFGDDDTWVWVVATYPDRVVYSVESQDAPAAYFEASYTVEADSVTFGEPVAVEVVSEVRAKALKAGRRISRATEAEISTAIDGMEKELQRLRGLLSQGDSEDEKDLSDAAEEAKAPAEEPKVKTDLDLLALNALIMKASS